MNFWKNVIVVVCCVVVSSIANGAVLAEYDADAGTPIENPAVQGWTEESVGSNTIAEGINDSGTNAWRIYDNSSSYNPRYSVSLSAGDLQNLYENGWEFSFTVKTVLGSQFCGWGLTAANDPGWGLTDRERVGFTVKIVGSNAFEIVPIHGDTITLNAESANDFHTIRCVGAPLSSQYEFYLDEVLQGTYDIKDGSSDSADDNLIKFASGSTSGTGREAYWHGAELAVLGVTVAESNGGTQVDGYPGLTISGYTFIDQISIVSGYYSFSIDLTAGWNLISLPYRFKKVW